ncbi:peptidase inhibitor family I36 protein [Streptomyces sp. NPDC032472]|uniref:peptidase inhibitor family I36 protein n=1 Tax=Streptomyces sp. NPDC032472 TaxID=3155018 RepID=UPI0033F91577
MRHLRIVGVAAAAIAAPLIATPAASAATTPLPAAPVSGTLSPAAEQQMLSEIATSKPVIATYKGKQINLAQNWEGARVCAEVSDGSVECFDSQGEADAALVNENASVARRESAVRKALGGTAAQAPASTSAIGDCGFGWICVWEHSDYSGRRLQWNAKGTKNLSNWGFRDQASSGCVNRYQYGASLVDFRDFQLDPEMLMGAGSCYDFTKASYVWGGTWNDKADAVIVN